MRHSQGIDTVILGCAPLNFKQGDLSTKIECNQETIVSAGNLDGMAVSREIPSLPLHFEF
jgi:hypothetical protein